MPVKIAAECKIVITSFEDDVGTGDTGDLPEVARQGGASHRQCALQDEKGSFIEIHTEHLFERL